MSKPISRNAKPPNRKERRKRVLAEQPEPPVVSGLTQKHRLPQVVKQLFTSILFWLIVAAAVGGFLFLDHPRVTVRPGKTLISGDPFQASFALTNDGYLPIRDLHHSLSLEKVEVGQTLRHVYSGVSETNIARLAPGSSSTISLVPFVDLLKQTIGIPLPPKSVTSAEVYVDLSYRSYLIPYTFTDRIRFDTAMSSTGEYVWSEHHGP